MQLIGGDLDGVKKERQAIRSKIKQIDDELKIIDKDIQTLQDELTAVTQKREKAFESIQQLRKQRDEGVCIALNYHLVIGREGWRYIWFVNVFC